MQYHNTLLLLPKVRNVSTPLQSPELGTAMTAGEKCIWF
jgi:hypothetical protein